MRVMALSFSSVGLGVGRPIFEAVLVTHSGGASLLSVDEQWSLNRWTDVCTLLQVWILSSTVINDTPMSLHAVDSNYSGHWKIHTCDHWRGSHLCKQCWLWPVKRLVYDPHTMHGTINMLYEGNRLKKFRGSVGSSTINIKIKIIYK